MPAWPHIPVLLQTSHLLLGIRWELAAVCWPGVTLEISRHEGFPTRLVSLMPDPPAAKSRRGRGLTPPGHPLTSSEGLSRHNWKHRMIKPSANLHVFDRVNKKIGTAGFGFHPFHSICLFVQSLSVQLYSDVRASFVIFKDGVRSQPVEIRDSHCLPESCRDMLWYLASDKGAVPNHDTSWYPPKTVTPSVQPSV